jgi:hypothetical protein
MGIVCDFNRNCRKTLLSIVIIEKVKREKQGTSPLTGERAQSDFARTPSWSFWHSRIKQRVFARASSPLRFNPRSRSHLVDQDFPNAPDMIG